MNNELDNLIQEIDFENLSIMEVSKILNEKFDLSSISRSMARIREKKQLKPANNFGNCGINPEANPCGDANQY
jgi:hypothetical protein